MNYAIIETGGKQYKVSEGDVIYVEKLNVEVGANLTFENVLVVGKDETANFGAPYIAGAKVEATVLEQGKEKKIVVYKFKSKKHFHKKKGHRQPFTSVKIEAIKA